MDTVRRQRGTQRQARQRNHWALTSIVGFSLTLEQRGARLQHGLEAAAQAAGVPVQVQRVGSMWTVFFSARPIRSWDDAAAVDREAFARFFRAMLARGVLLPPSAFESAFLSAAHDDGIVDQTIQAAQAAFVEARA